VVLACRDIERGKQAADRIRSAVPSADVEVAELDLAAIASVRAFAAGWNEPLDLLVNNAGVMAPPKFTKTQDGFELQFGTNHLGHYVLTGLLLPALLASPAPRVVTVASVAHVGGSDDVLDANVATPYVPQRAYSNSKLANLLFALELQRQAQSRGLPLVSAAAHPGLAATGLFSSRQGMGSGHLVRLAAPVLLRALTQPATVGARPSLYAATEAAPGSYTGPTRFGETRGEIGPARRSRYAQDERLGHRLWRASEDLTGFIYPWPAAS
ncbi:MAG: SDR family NAD(P)-dependent oxidoreductase, partial [Acidimicrobiales bacterium]